MEFQSKLHTFNARCTNPLLRAFNPASVQSPRDVSSSGNAGVPGRCAEGTHKAGSIGHTATAGVEPAGITELRPSAPLRYDDRMNSHPATRKHADTRYGVYGLCACLQCDRLHRLPAFTQAARAACDRCGATLFRHHPRALDRVLALNLSVLLLLAIVNSFPLLTLKLGGRAEQAGLLSSVQALWDAGQWELALLVALTSMVFPLLTALGWVYMLAPLKFGLHPPALARVYRWTTHLASWSLIGVFMLGALIAIFKLLDLATVIPGTALFALAALLVASAAARVAQSPGLVWPLLGPEIEPQHGHPHALEHGFHSCHHCRLLVPDELPACPRCHSRLHARKPNSIKRTMALLLSAAILFIPANVYPVMSVTRLGAGEPSTILGGVMQLIEAGMLPLALLVLFASIVVPGLKLLIFSYLLFSIQRGSAWRPLDRTRLYRFVEVVGAWSMVDIYLVAILAAVVQLDFLATIRPGIGATFFAAVVVLTMFAAHSFDPRLIWDNNGNRTGTA